MTARLSAPTAPLMAPPSSRHQNTRQEETIMTTRCKPTRRALLAGAAAFPLLTMLKWPASAAEFELKYATGQDPSHPVNLRAQEALTRIREATSGRVDIKLFPANQLGSDTDLLTQVRNGSVEFFTCHRSSWRLSCPSRESPASALPSRTTTRFGEPWTVNSATISVPRSRKRRSSPSRRYGTTASAMLRHRPAKSGAQPT